VASRQQHLVDARLHGFARHQRTAQWALHGVWQSAPYQTKVFSGTMVLAKGDLTAQAMMLKRV
jgi:hypothetical protein